MANVLCTNNDRDLWKEVHKTQKCKRTQSVSVENIRDENDINFIFTNTYTNVYNSVPYDWDEMESIKKRVHNKIQASNSVQYIINVQDVIKCIKHLKAGKSVGDKSLMSDHIFNAPHCLSVLNVMIIHGMSPESMLIASLQSHYTTVTQFQYILIIFIAWEFATN